MTILVWIIVGLIAGWIASRLMGAGGYGRIGDIIVGMIGAVVGGWLLSRLLGMDVTGLNLERRGMALIANAAVIVICLPKRIQGLLWARGVAAPPLRLGER